MEIVQLQCLKKVIYAAYPPLSSSKSIAQKSVLFSVQFGLYIYNMKENEIHLNDVLRQLDELSTPDGVPIYHDIAFIKYSNYNKQGNGELVRMHKVQKCGQAFDMKDAMRKGLKDINGNIRNCHIRLIIEFNNLKVVW